MIFRKAFPASKAMLKWNGGKAVCYPPFRFFSCFFVILRLDLQVLRSGSSIFSFRNRQVMRFTIFQAPIFPLALNINIWRDQRKDGIFKIPLAFFNQGKIPMPGFPKDCFVIMLLEGVHKLPNL
jgi:hypothetical protein